MTQNITTQPIGRTIARLSVPIFVSMVINSLWLSADIYFLGRIASGYIAVVTYLSPCLFVVYALLEGLSVPLIVLTGRAVGTGNQQCFAQVRDAGWSLLCGSGFLISMCGLALLPVITRMFAMTTVVAEGFTIYALCFISSIFPWCIRTYQSALCGGAGRTSPSYVGSLSFVGIKVVMQVWLLLSGHISISGIGFSTICAMWLSVALTALYLRRFSIHARPERLIYFPRILIGQFLAMSLPVVAGNLLGAIESGVTLSFFDRYGTETLSALGLLERIRTMALFPAIAIGVGISIFVSQHIGAGQMARARHGISATFRAIIFAYAGVAIICYVCIAPILSLLAPDATIAREFATLVARSELIGFPCLALGCIGQGAFEGTGKTYPNLVTLAIVVIFGRLFPYLIFVPEAGPMALRYILPWSHLLHTVQAIWFTVAIRRRVPLLPVRQPYTAIEGYAS